MTAAEGAGPAPLTGARTLWELVARRASLTPSTQCCSSRRRGAHVRRVRTALRGRRGRHGRARVGRARSSPGSSHQGRTVVLSMALAVSAPSRTRSCTCTASARSASHCARRTPSCSVCPGVARYGLHRAGRTCARGADRAPTLLVLDVDCPRGTRRLTPAPAASDAEGSPVRWIYYTSGSTAEPKGVRHTDQTLLAGAGVSPEPLR